MNVLKIAFVGALLALPVWGGAQQKAEITWDRLSLKVDGRRVMPVMGEVHYSRIPAAEWREEVRKMKEGGVTMVANYVFWNHVEEEEGIFDWSGQRSLRTFLEVCKEEDMPVVLRVGPFCHGEARNGGIPDWMFSKGCKMRQEDPTFLKYTTLLYRQIFTQVQGLQWKDGGPVVALQFDNEYRGHGSYLMRLKEIALSIGFDLPFYTRTGWPELKTPVPYGEMIPLYGDYADGFWERSLAATAGNYYKAFNFKAFRSSTAIATEQLGEQKAHLADAEKEYPFFTCELGGGMATAYHRRPFVYGTDAYSLAIVKLGSGSNLLGYYMYHGGTNPDGKVTTLQEQQRSLATNYNDMPVKTYDFQAPLGEFGQRREHFYLLRPLHLFMHDYGESLAPMEASFPTSQDLPKGDDKTLRWAYRTQGDSGFVFVNNYERLQPLSAKSGIQFDVCGVKFPQKAMTIPAGAMAIFPVGISGIRYATAQIVAQREGKIYLMQVPGIPTEIAFQGGTTLRNVKARGTEKPIYKSKGKSGKSKDARIVEYYLLSQEEAGNLFLAEESRSDRPVEETLVVCKKVQIAGPLRKIEKGVQRVAMEPTDEEFEAAAVYEIEIPKEKAGRLLDIEYIGDCARLYAEGQLIDDNFYNGRHFEYGLWRLPENVRKLQLRILPLHKGMPIYFPAEAITNGEREAVVSVTIR